MNQSAAGTKGCSALVPEFQLNIKPRYVFVAQYSDHIKHFKLHIHLCANVTNYQNISLFMFIDTIPIIYFRLTSLNMSSLKARLRSPFTSAANMIPYSTACPLVYTVLVVVQASPKYEPNAC